MILSFKYFIFILFFAGLIHLETDYCFGQHNKIDSLQKQLSIFNSHSATFSSDTTKTNLLNSIALEIRFIHPDTAIAFSTKALLLSEKLNWEKGIAISHNQLGIINKDKGNYSVAFEHLNKALVAWVNLEKNSNQKEKNYFLNREAATLGSMGIVYDEQSNYPAALDYYFRALKIAEITGDKKRNATALGNIGLVYAEQSKYEKALDYYQKALKIDEVLKNKNGISRHYGNIAMVYFLQRNYSKALDCYLSVLKSEEGSGNKEQIALWSGDIGATYGSLNQPSKAIEYYVKALKLYEGLGDKNGIAVQLGNIGLLYKDQKQYQKSEEYILKALKIADSIQSLNLILDQHKYLSELYEQKGDYKKAFEQYKQQILAKDSLFNQEKEKEITKHEMNYEFEKKETAEKAEQDKKDAVAATEKQRQKITIYAISCGLILLLILTCVIFRSLNVNKKKNEIITVQKELVEEKQKEILDSIHYAKRIQQSLLPREKYIDKNLKRLNKSK